MLRQTLARACGVLCAILLYAPHAAAQEYYGVPIEDGGVAFLLDVSGSMNNQSEKMKAAAESIVRGLASAVEGTSFEQSKLGQALKRAAAGTSTTPQLPKMAAARRDLLHALGSLGEGTNFTIITFGERAVEWPGGVRAAGPSTRNLAGEYVASLTAGGGTPMAEALQLGFQSPNVRTLFVVSDGRPTSGEVLQLVQRLQDAREGRRMVINTVGIGRDQDTGLLCQLALDNEGVYVRDGTVACTFSPCAQDDGLVTFYPPSAVEKEPRVATICSAADHPDCTSKLVFDTMLSKARYQAPTRDETSVTNCLEVDDPAPITIVTHEDGLEATNYTRPGHPSHPGRITRIVKNEGDDVVVETTGAGKLRPHDFETVDEALAAEVYKILGLKKPEEGAEEELPLELLLKKESKDGRKDDLSPKRDQ